MPEPASIYVCKPSETDPTVAPGGSREPLRPRPGAGRHPHRRAAATTARARSTVERTADAAIDQVARWAGVPTCASGSRAPHGRARGLRARATTRGAAGRSASSTRCARAPSSARATPRRRSTGCSTPASTTVPGVGLPMCLISAELVLKRLTGDRSSAAGGRPMSLLHWSYVAMLAFCLAGTLPLVPAFRLRRAAPARDGCCSPSLPGRHAVPAVGPLRHRTPATGASTPARRCPGASAACRSRRSASSS